MLLRNFSSPGMAAATFPEHDHDFFAAKRRIFAALNFLVDAFLVVADDSGGRANVP